MVLVTDRDTQAKKNQCQIKKAEENKRHKQYFVIIKRKCLCTLLQGSLHGSIFSDVQSLDVCMHASVRNERKEQNPFGSIYFLLVMYM